MPRATIDTLMERGIDARHAVDESGEAAERVQSGLSDAGIDMDDVTAVLLADGVKAFADSYDMLMTRHRSGVRQAGRRDRREIAAPRSW